MHKMGLHGKSFIPLIMGFGCNVPAVMATRTIESRRSRLITMLILPMMSCSARLPIYIMITGTFFAVKYQSLIMISLYAIGIVMAVVVSRVLSRWLIRGEDTPFVMELPPYRFPTAKAIGRHTWEKGKQYLKKMGGIILFASIVVWALGYFPHDDSLSQQQQQEQSYIGRIGKAIEPVFRAQGFDWKLDVGLVAGVGAKEIVASTMGVLQRRRERGRRHGRRQHAEVCQPVRQDGSRRHNAADSLCLPDVYRSCSYFPMLGHHCSRQERKRLVEMGCVHSRLHHRAGMDCVGTDIPDRPPVRRRPTPPQQASARDSNHGPRPAGYMGRGTLDAPLRTNAKLSLTKSKGCALFHVFKVISVSLQYSSRTR